MWVFKCGIRPDTGLMAEVSTEELDDCVRRISGLWGIEVDDSGHEHAAGEAAASLMSGSGLLYVPPEILRMLRQAIEIGYAAALKSVEDG
ncbi:Uncharacterised protein [Mycobacterium tuberculosis]|nr:Uncharacterised protein [Mycobacterium tuberculosis]